LEHPPDPGGRLHEALDAARHGHELLLRAAGASEQSSAYERRGGACPGFLPEPGRASRERQPPCPCPCPPAASSEAWESRATALPLALLALLAVGSSSTREPSEPATAPPWRSPERARSREPEKRPLRKNPDPGA